MVYDIDRLVQDGIINSRCLGEIPEFGALIQKANESMLPVFELTKEELSRSQFVTLNKGRGENFKYLPFAFTELGVAMLSSVLKSDIAIEINRGIMRAFILIRQFPIQSRENDFTLLQNEVKELKEYIEEVFADYNDINDDTRMQLELINQTLAELQSKKSLTDKPRPKIGFVK